MSSFFHYTCYAPPNNIHPCTDEFPSLDFLLPYTGNTLQTKLLLGAFAGLVFGIMLILVSSLLIVRWRRSRRKRLAASSDVASAVASGCGGSSSIPNNNIVDTGQTISTGNSVEQSFGGGGGGLCSVGGYGNTTLRTIGGTGVITGSTDSLDKNPDIIPAQGEFCGFCNKEYLTCSCAHIGKDDGEFDDANKMHWSTTRPFGAAMSNQYSVSTTQTNHAAMYINYTNSGGDYHQHMPVSSHHDHMSAANAHHHTVAQYGNAEDNQVSECGIFATNFFCVRTSS